MSDKAKITTAMWLKKEHRTQNHHCRRKIYDDDDDAEDDNNIYTQRLYKTQYNSICIQNQQ